MFKRRRIVFRRRELSYQLFNIHRRDQLVAVSERYFWGVIIQVYEYILDENITAAFARNKLMILFRGHLQVELFQWEMLSTKRYYRTHMILITKLYKYKYSR